MSATPATLLIFWDYDTKWGADRSRAPGGPKAWGHLEFEHTERLLELHAAHGVPACFAVVGAAALPGERPYHDPDQIRRIAAAGHEVASHALRHDWLPALGPDALRETLRRSKAALEECTGAAVTSFVPPYNQPFDYAAGLSFSLSERREARGPGRTDLRRLCVALGETGYQFCRVAYRPLPVRLAEATLGRRLDRPAALERIAGVACVRLNTPCGFAAESLAMVRRCAEAGGIAAVYGHPHSLGAGGPQDRRHLEPFLAAVARLRDAGRLRICTPRQLLAAPAYQASSA